jgi:hypothetical protein
VRQHYREFMVAHLPQLEVLDGTPISETERSFAQDSIRRRIEPPVTRPLPLSLCRREIGEGA